MKNAKGFSLIELLIVVAIIGIISAVALPQIVKAKRTAHAASAIQTLRMITTAEILYHRKNNSFGDMALLNPEGTLDPTVVSGYKSSYGFVLVLSDFDPQGRARNFEVNATPLEGPTTLPHYFVNATGVIRYEDGAPATATSAPIPR